jgi:hypothetical protein
MKKHPELRLLRKSLGYRGYELKIVCHEDDTVLILSRNTNMLERTAFLEIEDCGFSFSEVKLDDYDDNGRRIKAIFHRYEKDGFSDLA